MHRSSWKLRFQVTLTCCALVLGAAGAQANDENSGAADVIVRFKPSPDHVGHQRFLHHGALHKRSLGLIGAEVFTAKQEDLALLAADPEVEYIGPDHPVHATATLPSTPDYGWMTALGVSSITATLPYDGTGVE